MGVLDGWIVCPRCGQPLANGGQRAHCAACGADYYASSAPATAALVTDDQGRILLARRAHEPDAGLWDTPGGFLDEGEAPEDGLRRELLEETGLDVELGSFVGAFMDVYGDAPGAPAVLNLVWRARVLGGEAVPADDVSELAWFPIDALPAPDACAFTWVSRLLRQLEAHARA